MRRPGDLHPRRARTPYEMDVTIARDMLDAIRVSDTNVHDSQALLPLVVGMPAIRSRHGPRGRHPGEAHENRYVRQPLRRRSKMALLGRPEYRKPGVPGLLLTPPERISPGPTPIVGKSQPDSHSHRTHDNHSNPHTETRHHEKVSGWQQPLKPRLASFSHGVPDEEDKRHRKNGEVYS
jgi:hypothetical protein